MVKTPRNTFLWTVTIGAGACGVALAIAESSGFSHVRLVFSVAALLGLLWFILDVFLFPYRKLKVVGSGFSFVDHLNQSHDVQLSDVIGISVTRIDGALEWFIQTASGELICVMQDDFCTDTGCTIGRRSMWSDLMRWRSGMHFTARRTALGSVSRRRPTLRCSRPAPAPLAWSAELERCAAS